MTIFAASFSSHPCLTGLRRGGGNVKQGMSHLNVMIILKLKIRPVNVETLNKSPEASQKKGVSIELEKQLNELFNKHHDNANKLVKELDNSLNGEMDPLKVLTVIYNKISAFYAKAATSLEEVTRHEMWVIEHLLDYPITPTLEEIFQFYDRKDINGYSELDVCTSGFCHKASSFRISDLWGSMSTAIIQIKTGTFNESPLHTGKYPLIVEEV